MTETHGRVVAAFDFDRTLTRRDTLLPFLRYLCGRRAVARSLLRHSVPLGVACALDNHPRRAGLKERVLSELLSGRRGDDVLAAGRGFAWRLTRPARLRPDMVSRWRWHQDNEHEIVIVSASLEAYIEPFAAEMGGATVLATRLGMDSDGVLTGAFDGGNCRGAEKVRRLREWGLSPEVELWAYGDSSGDREMLMAAQVPHHVRRRGRLLPGSARDGVVSRVATSTGPESSNKLRDMRHAS